MWGRAVVEAHSGPRRYGKRSNEGGSVEDSPNK
jgi:hypothetical protein